MPDYTLLRGDTWTQPLSGLGILTGRTKLWFTAKMSTQDTDLQAVFQIEEAAGLLRLNGAAGTPGDGSLVVVSEAGGTATVTLSAEATRQLGGAARLRWDCQVAFGATVNTRSSGWLTIPLDATRAVG